MQKRIKAQARPQLLIKVLALLLIIAIGVAIWSVARNYWQNMNLEKARSQEQIVKLQEKIEALHLDMQNLLNNNQVDVQAINTAQIRNAYLLVRTAAVCLKNDQDVEVAKQLVQMATEQLAAVHNSKADKAKTILAADQAKLNAVVVADKGLMQTKLDLLDKLINVLPPYGASNVQSQNVLQTTPCKKSWYQAICNMFGDLKNIIKVRKRTDQTAPVTDVDLARAQFKLLIEQLRWAAFYNNAEIYQRSIKNAQDLLPKLFDMNSESVQKFAATLNELQQVQLRSELPSLQNSVNALQAILVG